MIGQLGSEIKLSSEIINRFNEKKIHLVMFNQERDGVNFSLIHPNSFDIDYENKRVVQI